MSPAARQTAKVNFDMLMSYREFDSRLNWDFDEFWEISEVVKATGCDDAKELLKEVDYIEDGFEDLSARLFDVGKEVERIVRSEFGIELLYNDYDFAIIYELVKSPHGDDEVQVAA